MKKVYLFIASLFFLGVVTAQTPDYTIGIPYTLPASGTTYNTGLFNEVTFNYLTATTSSSTYSPACNGVSTGTQLRVASSTAYTEWVASGAATITRLDCRLSSNSTTAGVAIVAFSPTGASGTWSGWQELALPSTATGCQYHTLTSVIPAGTKYVRMARAFNTTNFPGSSYTPIGTTGQTIRVFELQLYLTPSTPTITTSLTSLAGFSQAGVTPSSSQIYTVSGTALSAATVDLAAPTSFEISTDNSTWLTNISLPVSSGIITGQPKTIYARLNDPVAGSHSGDITHTSTGATTKLVNISGNTVTVPTVTVSQSTQAYNYVQINTNSAEQSYNVSGVLLTPAADNITITAPAGYQISTTSGSGFSNSIILPYTGGSLSSTPIYVRFSPTATSSYPGNISHTGGGAGTANVAVSGTGTIYGANDYGSNGTGNWGTAGTWRKFNSVSGAFDVVVGAAPAATDNVWIINGHTVTVEAGGKNCKNLYVYGSLVSSSTVSSPFYINVSGTELNVYTGGNLGTAGVGDAADGLSINHLTSASITVSGTGGTINLSRFRTNTANTVVTIDHDMTLNYHGTTNQGGHTIAYYPQAGDNSVLTINAGKTLTFAPWACLATTASSNGFPALSVTVNVNGTLTLQNSPAPNAGTPTTSSYIYGGVASGKIFTLNVGATGVVNTYQFYPNGLSANPGTGTGTGSDAVLTVASGGQFNVSGMADFRKSTQTITGAGAFSVLSGARLKIGSPQGISAFPAVTGQILTTTRNYNAGAIYEYDSTSVPQVTGDGLPSSIAALIVNNNTSNVSVTNSFTALDSIRFISGKLILDANNAITGSVKNASSTNYVVTNSTGTLGLNIPATTGSYNFPIGYNTTIYRPATINFTVAPTAGTIAARSINGFPGNTGLPLTELAISPSIPDNVALAGDDFWEVNQVSGTGGTYDATFIGNGQTNMLDFNNTTIIKRPNALGSWAIEGTHVATTGSNTAPVLSRTGLTGFSQFGIGGPVGALPVSLISFNGTLQNSQVKLFWKTENEINVRQYIIEKSTDGRAYSNIGSVAALNGVTNNYTFTDATSLAGVAYYRLKIMDRDGSYKYSTIIAINNKKPGVLSIFPNPVNNTVFISHDKAAAGAKIEVYAMDGRKVLGATATTGATQTTVNASSLPAGNYNLVFANGDQVQFIKFVKQ